MAGTSLEAVKMELEEEHEVTIKDEISPVEEMCAFYVMEEHKVTIKEEISPVEEMCAVYIMEEHKVTIKEEISPVEEMCAIYIKNEDIKMENTEIQGYLVLILLTYIM